MKLGYALFFVDDVIKTMEFYEKAFGLKKGFSNENEYGEMLTGETKVGFVCHQVAGSHGFDYERMHLQRRPAACEIGFVTDEVHSTFQRALSAGAISVSPPNKKPWGQTVSYVRDCNGFLVEICSPLGV